jgi:hypothetical protein
MIIRARRGEYELAHTWTTRFHRRFFEAAVKHDNSTMPAPGSAKATPNACVLKNPMVPVWSSERTVRRQGSEITPRAENTLIENDGQQ